ncbi:MAG TPA: flagellar basal body P-ring formation protein FlgA [Deltaproteobacteria bacterium]|nr:flagellar basal body P-ring formation protein FlgA [Deltaproteobacteria bacterium]
MKPNIVEAAIFALALFIGTVAVFPADAAGMSRGTTFTPGQLQQIIVGHIDKHMPWEPGTARVEFYDSADKLVLNGNNINYRVEARRNEDYIGRTSFNIRFYSGGVFLDERSVRVKIEVAKDFVVSTRCLGSGSVITEDDVTVVRRWVDRAPRNRIGDPGVVTGKVVRGSIAPNTELQERMIKDPQLVKRGDVVRVVLSRGGLRMEMAGISAEGGTLGDRIRVKNTSSSNLFYARVVDESEVRVEF